MKQILLSEGKYDVFFLEEFYQNFDRSLYTFKKEEVKKESDPRNKQTESLRSFIEPRSPYDVLVKSEGSKNNLLTFFSTQVYHLIENIDELIMIVDLDSDDEEGLENLEEKLSEKIEDRHSGSGCEVILNDPMQRNEYLVAVKGCLHLRDSFFGNFFVIGLKPNLEDIAGIDRESDNKETKREKIKGLLDEDKIIDFLGDVLVDRSHSSG